MIEIDVDMSYLLEYDELDKVVLNDENGEHEPMEFVPADAKAGSRSCASCPEMDNPDSYIAHLHRALEVADGGVGTCKDVCASNSEFTCSECGFNCDLMSWISLFDGDDGRHRHHHHGTPNYCPNCGARIEVNG